VNHDYNDDPMNESPPKSAETAWDHENEVHDSNHSILEIFANLQGRPNGR